MLPRSTVAIASALLVLPACLPIPWRKTYVMWPEGTVRVIDAGTDAPIPGAKIHLVREVYPHRREDGAREATADDEGEAHFTKETAVKTVFPLMMHGVPGYGFVVCAEAPGHASKTVAWSAKDEGASSTLEIALVEGSLPCDAKHEQKAPAPGEARVEGVERLEAGDAWRVHLVVRAEAPVFVGERLEGPPGVLEVGKIEWQGEPFGDLRRARVHAKGAADAKFGDVLRR